MVLKISSRACRVPGQPSQCSSVRGAWPHLGQLGRQLCCPLLLLLLLLLRIHLADTHTLRAPAVRHTRRLLTSDLAQTIACSLVLSRLDYCNAVLYAAPTTAVNKLQRVHNNAARIALRGCRNELTRSLCSSRNCIGCRSNSASPCQYAHLAECSSRNSSSNNKNNNNATKSISNDLLFLRGAAKASLQVRILEFALGGRPLSPLFPSSPLPC